MRLRHTVTPLLAALSFAVVAPAEASAAPPSAEQLPETLSFQAAADLPNPGALVKKEQAAAMDRMREDAPQSAPQAAPQSGPQAAPQSAPQAAPQAAPAPSVPVSNAGNSLGGPLQPLVGPLQHQLTHLPVVGQLLAGPGGGH
ncbi:hypothetical protein ABZ545_00620 [Streptomyces abikoensis]|uniref:Uncharacterized protein n=2 Tax=Streptomyces TaxID=1883 RepID=A0A3Q9FR47_STRLT|nr:hypothetical protein [Streptomyces luteoverticillatus]AZQ70173.1 hypothetical protein EKH77_02150 [Streptomyces luteoverticillatus]